MKPHDLEFINKTHADIVAMVKISAHRRLTRKEAIKIIAYLRFIESVCNEKPWYKKIFKKA